MLSVQYVYTLYKMIYNTDIYIYIRIEYEYLHRYVCMNVEGSPVTKEQMNEWMLGDNMYICIYIYVYTHVYRERERESHIVI